MRDRNDEDKKNRSVVKKVFKILEGIMLKKILLSVAIIFCFVSSSIAADLSPIKLFPPDMKGGKSLMQSLQERKTSRSFNTKKLPIEVLSNLLWSACGINRPDSGKRTAPSASNRQEIDVYVAMEEGLYFYNAKAHVLEPVLKNDLRKNTTTFPQPSRSSVEGAPLQLIYVADYSKMSVYTNDEEKKFYSAADTGFIAQNVYLYCSSEGLVTGVRGLVDRDALSKNMKLRDRQKIVLVQAVGYPE
jgi:SagB-type dehydrogenase family enzyme